MPCWGCKRNNDSVDNDGDIGQTEQDPLIPRPEEPSCLMTQEKRSMITYHRETLEQNMDMIEVEASLYAKNHITEAEHQEIMALGFDNHAAQNKKLLQVLLRKSNRAYEDFIQGLVESNQQQLSNLFVGTVHVRVTVENVDADRVSRVRTQSECHREGRQAPALQSHHGVSSDAAVVTDTSTINAERIDISVQPADTRSLLGNNDAPFQFGPNRSISRQRTTSGMSTGTYDSLAATLPTTPLTPMTPDSGCDMRSVHDLCLQALSNKLNDIIQQGATNEDYRQLSILNQSFQLTRIEKGSIILVFSCPTNASLRQLKKYVERGQLRRLLTMRQNYAEIEKRYSLQVKTLDMRIRMDEEEMKMNARLFKKKTGPSARTLFQTLFA